MRSIGEFGAPPANFNGFRVLPSLLDRCRSTEVNHTLHDVWPSSGLAHYIHFWGFLSPNGILPGAKFTLRPCLALSYIGIVTARRSSLAVCVSHCLRHGIFTRQGGHPIRHWAVELFSFYSSTGGLLAVSCQTNLSIIVANAIFSCY